MQKICESCRGIGEIKAPGHYRQGEAGVSEFCEDCNGTGYVETDEVKAVNCDSCNQNPNMRVSGQLDPQTQENGQNSPQECAANIYPKPVDFTADLHGVVIVRLNTNTGVPAMFRILHAFETIDKTLAVSTEGMQGLRFFNGGIDKADLDAHYQQWTGFVSPDQFYLAAIAFYGDIRMALHAVEHITSIELLRMLQQLELVCNIRRETWYLTALNIRADAIAHGREA